MAAAVEESRCIVLCMSSNYKDSANCRTEAEYVFQLRKPYVPLMVEKGYKPDGWLGKGFSFYGGAGRGGMSIKNITFSHFPSNATERSRDLRGQGVAVLRLAGLVWIAKNPSQTHRFIYLYIYIHMSEDRLLSRLFDF